MRGTFSLVAIAVLALATPATAADLYCGNCGVVPLAATAPVVTTLSPVTPGSSYYQQQGTQQGAQQGTTAMHRPCQCHGGCAITVLRPCQGCQTPACTCPTLCQPNGGIHSTFRPMVAVTPMPSATYLGRGIIGQPTAYVSGQPVRNMLRWMTP